MKGTVVVRTIPEFADARRVAIAGHATEPVWDRVWKEYRALRELGVRRVVLDLLCAMSGAHGWDAAVAIGAMEESLIANGGGVVVVSTSAGLREAMAKARAAKVPVPLARTVADAVAMLPGLLREPPPPPGPPPVPVARLAGWDQDGPDRRVVVEGTIALPSGRLVACDLLEAVNHNRHALGPDFECGPSCEVLSASVVDARGRTLLMVGARLSRERPARWERAGRFDNSRARFAALADPQLLETVGAEPDFYDGLYYPWIDEALAIHSGTTEWWEVRQLERPGAGSAFVFLSNREGTALPVYAGYSASGSLAAVVIEVARAE